MKTKYFTPVFSPKYKMYCLNQQPLRNRATELFGPLACIEKCYVSSDWFSVEDKNSVLHEDGWCKDQPQTIISQTGSISLPGVT